MAIWLWYRSYTLINFALGIFNKIPNKEKVKIHFLRSPRFGLFVSFLTNNVYASTTGTLELTNSNGNAASTYQLGDDVHVRVTDSDVNTDTGSVETLLVHVTSETEDTRTPFSVSPPVPGASNTGDDAMTILKTNYDTKMESWTLSWPIARV